MLSRLDYSDIMTFFEVIKRLEAVIVQKEGKK
jgi:hypothetical protein